MRQNIIRFILPASAIILGLIFLLAAFSKIANLEEFSKTLDVVIFLPQWSKGLVILLLPGLELTLGLCLINRFYLREAGLLSSVLVMGFLAFGIYSNLTKHPSACGCFGAPMPTWLDPSGWWIVVRDLIFLGLGFICFFHSTFTEESL
jgi:hypothetical protein